MNKLLFSLATIATLGSFAQTASNFNVNDCLGNNHDLFSELNSGKVVVITWVMPCSSCVGGATSAQNAVNSFSASHPGQVLNYIADDYGNSSCTTVNNWCASNNLTPHAIFTSTAVSMSPYGTAGMPKTIVLGGSSHTVYYNVNGSGNINQSAIQNAITNALTTVSVKENISQGFQTKISPNPVNSELRLSIKETENLNIELFSLTGQKVRSIEHVSGKEVKINTESLPDGCYFLKMSDGKNSETVKFLIAH